MVLINPTDERPKNIKLHFGVESHKVDLAVLVTTLKNTTEIIDIIHHYNKFDNKIKIKIGAPSRGSLEIILELMSSGFDMVRTLFTNDNISVIQSIITTYIELFKLSKFERENASNHISKTENENGIVILNSGNNNPIEIQKNTYNIYYGTPAKSSVRETFEALAYDDTISDFTIKTNVPGVEFTANKEEINNISTFEDISSPDEQIVTRRVTLNIVRVAFDSKMNWDFIFEGRRIGAKIKDKIFHENIEKRLESFHKGDAIEVELKIKQLFEPEFNTWVNKSFVISKVYKHHKLGNQTNLLNQ